MTADQGKVLRSELAADPSTVLAERDVEHVVQLVLDLPVATNEPREALGLGRQVRDVERARGRELSSASDAYDFYDGLQIGPRRSNLFGQPSDRHGSDDAPLGPSVPSIALDRELRVDSRHSVECLDGVIVEVALVALEREDVMGATISNGSCHVGCAAGSVRSHGRTAELQTGQQLDRGRRFMPGRLDRRLRKQKSLLGRPNVEEVKRSASAPCVGQGATERLSIDRERFPVELAENGVEPAAKRLLEGLRIERFEDTTERVGAGRAMGHVEKLGEGLLVDLGIVRQRIPAVRSSQGAEERHRQDVHERVSAGARDARVFELAEDVQQRLQRRRGLGLGHVRSGSRSKKAVSIERQVIETDQLLMRSPCSVDP